MVSETMNFKVHRIEEYRLKHNLTAPETLEPVERYDVFGLLDEPALRWQSLEIRLWT
ncbi:MAG: hypothetical protein J6O90_00290 [Candidatus Methanomethylophilaceae archaeon]|nr:hypothetical protein [Candidatus Methanomethylophilaceae archaeon]MBO7410125.1 hypothetical protein [Candidatus Methanomethylophilaceae archaeon]